MKATILCKNSEFSYLQQKVNQKNYFFVKSHEKSKLKKGHTIFESVQKAAKFIRFDNYQ